MRTIKHYFAALTAVVLLAVLATGCALLQDSAPTVQLTTQYATLKVVNGDPERAAKVVDLVTNAKQYVEGDSSVTIAALEHAARSRIPWDDLDPADVLLIDAILSQARERLELEIGAGLLNPEQRVQLSTFLSWIESAAYAVAQR